MVLHTVNKSPFSHSLLKECLSVMGTNHRLLLLEDGVYAALKTSPVAEDLVNRHHTVYALAPDLQARGLISEALLICINPVTYEDFVRLVTEHDKVQSWF